MYRSFEQDQSLYPLPPSTQYSGAIIVKFRNGSNLQTAQGSGLFFRSANPAADNDLAEIGRALTRANARAPERLFTRPASDLQAERTLAERNVGEELPDLTQFFTIPVADYRAAGELLDALRTNKLVEVAYAKPLPVPPPTPDLTSYQLYFASAASNGYDVNYARTRPGGWGTRARLIDIEYQWELDHEDLQMNLTNILWGTEYTAYGPDHGTAVLGISGALVNGYGMDGIIPFGRIDVIGATDTNGSYALANAINAAVPFTVPGDVILIEQQGYNYNLNNYCPVEYDAAVYSAIANVTALQRVIIEPAGNGNLNLDDPAWGGIFQRATRDSGAVMVGAGIATNRARCSFSCYGSRVDIQGWGDWSVATLGYGDLYGSSETDYYTAVFAGTSSASALSAAVAALIQSYAQTSYGFYLPPLALRSNLVQSGYAQTYGLPGNIGPLPNLSNAFAAVDASAVPPQGSFIAIPTNGPTPLTVTFADTWTGVITNRFWAFGDGNTTNVATIGVVYTYNTAGVYSVTEIVSSTSGSSTGTVANYITAWTPPPVASFTAIPTTGLAPLLVIFTDTSVGNITNRFWNFGDGITTNITATSVSHTYAAGSYTVALTVSGLGGTNTSTLVNYIVAANPPPPVANFRAGPTDGAVPLTVTFIDNSYGSPTTWYWTFGDGGSSTNVTELNPTYTYQTPGAWTATLVASNAGGASGPFTQTINAYDPYQWWRLNYFLITNSASGAPGADPYGTGMSNTNRFLAGFNPNNPAAYVHIIGIAKTNRSDVNVIYLGANGDNTWSLGVASRTNVLEFTTGTADGSYSSNNFASTGQTNILSGGNGLGIVTNMTDFGGATNSPSRYYRVRVLLP
jgi:PKD repeat protein